MRSPMARAPIMTLLVALSACDGGIFMGEHTPDSAGVALQGRQILFVGTEPSGESHLLLIRDDGEGLVDLTEGLPFLEEGGVIAPTSDLVPQPVPTEDGRRVLFAVGHLDASAQLSSRTLYQIDVESRDVSGLGNVPNSVRRVFYDLAGETVLVELRDESSGRIGLYVLEEGALTPIDAGGQELTFDAHFPDGDRLLVRIGSAPERQLAVLDLRDRSVTPLGAAPGLDVLSPRLSADGERVVFQGWSAEAPCSELYQLRLDGDGTATDLNLAESTWEDSHGAAPGDHEPLPADGTPTPAPGPDEPEAPLDPRCLSVSSPSWSPSHTSGAPDLLSFLATSDSGSGRVDAFVVEVEADGSLKRLRNLSDTLGLTTDPGVTSAPRWAPDGDDVMFVFTAFDAEAQTYEVDVHVAEARGGQDVPLTQGYEGVPSLAQWDADGRDILFWATSSAGDTAATTSDAVVASLDGGELTAVTRDAGYHVSYPLWLTRNSLLY